MIGWLDVLLSLAFTTILAGSALLAFQLAGTPIAARPTLGYRGLKRSASLSHSSIFKAVEPLVRALAAWFAVLPLERVRRPLRLSLIHSGEYLGLSEDELIALSVLFGLGLGTVSLLVCDVLQLPQPLSALGLVVGVLAPWFRVATVAKTRARCIGRQLPAAVELAAMCMGAGLDFPGSLRRITAGASDARDPLTEEFARVLQELDLGHTRKSAMEGFALRVPIDQVRELVNSVVQAEAKGSPLASVLIVQAQTQRLRRSIAAEETAADAALMLLGPMTLIFLCVIALLLGPVVVRFMTGGLGPA